MLEKLFKKPDKCKCCQKPLSGENLRIGYCDECADREIDKLKKRVLISGIAGVVLVVLVFAAIYYARTNYYISEEYGYKGDVFVPVIFGKLAFNLKSFNRITNLSTSGRILLGLFCFCVPFSSYVQLEYKTYRHKAESNLYKMDAFTANLAAGSNSQRMDDAGFFIMSLVVSAVSGPYFLVYRVYQLLKLTNYKKKAAAGGGFR